ncbi:flagellar assembly factor FliW [Paenibacillus tianmuensis]|uniref:Flagellar assembly factor FliW n=1 Tax=Paenibacillus tianmuensis TaxID=624147 RepID=A0A1G4RNP3_9BACL|nr:flagellar assembly protein FliW [Paenibacillus tianmuensis]SCW58562.1 flagellar assembly factor FliW [Paenibacillus tianmuensis]
MLSVLHNKSISFQGSVLGFENFDRFRFSVVDEEQLYGYLQSEDDESIGFLVINPFVIYPDYVFEVEENTREKLGIKSPEEVAVIGIITIQDPFSKSTLNLLAPLIINVTNGKGTQIVLPPKSNYRTKEPLFKYLPAESGEKGC